MGKGNTYDITATTLDGKEIRFGDIRIVGVDFALGGDYTVKANLNRETRELTFERLDSQEV